MGHIPHSSFSPGRALCSFRYRTLQFSFQTEGRVSGEAGVLRAGDLSPQGRLTRGLRPSRVRPPRGCSPACAPRPRVLPRRGRRASVAAGAVAAAGAHLVSPLQPEPAGRRNTKPTRTTSQDSRRRRQPRWSAEGGRLPRGPPTRAAEKRAARPLSRPASGRCHKRPMRSGAGESDGALSPLTRAGGLGRKTELPNTRFRGFSLLFRFRVEKD